jgi:hypothetical protein
MRSDDWLGSIYLASLVLMPLSFYAYRNRADVLNFLRLFGLIKGDHHRSKKKRERKVTSAYDQPKDTKRIINLTDFDQAHQKIGAPITKHRCGRCQFWSGPRTSHPVRREMYVAIGTKGKCIHKHPGSPYGIKRHDAGTQCKDYQQID